MMIGERTEAGESAKGFRLQRLRAVKLLLEALIDNHDAHVLAAIEYAGDVRIEEDGHVKIDEAKNYKSVSSFSFANSRVLHAVVQFLLLYLENREGQNLRFGFYTNVAIGKEAVRDLVKELRLDLPSRAIIEHLRDGEFAAKQLLPCVTALVSHQLVKERGEDDAFVARLMKWDDERWVAFLKQISWHFGEPDEEALFTEVAAMIPKYPRFTASHRGKEEHIVAVLLDKLERRQTKTPLARLLGRAEVDLVFLEAAMRADKPLDPLWKAWQEEQAAHVATGDTARGIEEKLRDALTDPDDAECTGLLADWGDHAAMGQIEWSSTDSDPNMQGLRLRVLRAAQRVLRGATQDGDVALLAATLSEVHAASQAEVDEYAECHEYVYSGPSSTRKLIATLFDKCFLNVRTDDPR